MKKLYALLVILIIAYVGINFAADSLHLNDSDDNSKTGSNSANAVNASLPSLDSFNKTQINDTTVSYTDASYNMTIYLDKIDNGKEISDVVGGLDKSAYTSNQTITENGATSYFLYKEGPDSYGADIFFNKNNQNYVLSGTNITYENSDYFISHCKSIINSLGSGGNSTGFSRW
jgi:hypothetical protein